MRVGFSGKNLDEVLTDARRKDNLRPEDTVNWWSFPQIHSNTSCGHAGAGMISGAAMTHAQTVVVENVTSTAFYVYFRGRFCYEMPLDDYARQCLEDKHFPSKYEFEQTVKEVK